LAINDHDVIQFWDKYCKEWLNRTGEEGDLYQKQFIIPSVLKLLGEVNGRTILDIACGSGIFSRYLARRGAVVTGVDISSVMLEQAIATECQLRQGIKYRLCHSAELKNIETMQYDIVTCNMGLMDILDYRTILHEAARVLRPKGIFVASLLHPCFCTPGAGWIRDTDKPKYWRVDRYFHRECGTDLYCNAMGLYFHRTLGDYLNSVITAGLTIKAVDEPEPSADMLKQGRYTDMLRVADFLVIRADKQSSDD